MIKSIERFDGKGRITSKVRRSLKGPCESETISFVLTELDDLLEKHDRYFVMLHDKGSGGEITTLYTFTQQSLFPDFCEGEFDSCYMLANRRSVFTQTNVIVSSELIEGIALVSDVMHAMINWPAAERVLLGEQDMWKGAE